MGCRLGAPHMTVTLFNRLYHVISDSVCTHRMQNFFTPNRRESIGFALGGPMETSILDQNASCDCQSLTAVSLSKDLFPAQSVLKTLTVSLARALCYFDSARNPAFLTPMPIGSRGENRCSMG